MLLDRNIFRPLHDVMLEAPLYATMGEHDLFYSNGAAVADALHLPNDAGRYVVDYGPVQVVLLGLDDGPAEVAFARRALAQPGPRVRFVVLHRPVQPGDSILPLLRRRHVAAVIAGHLHRYERRMVGGIPEFTVGTGGEGPGAAEFTKRSPDAIVSLLDYGSLRVSVTAAGIALPVHRRARPRARPLLDRMTGLRVTLGILGAAGVAAGLLIGRPAVLFPLAALGILAFVVAAGCLAADLLPLRRAYAVTSGLALIDAVLLVVAGQASRPLAVVAAAALVALSAAPRVIRGGA